MTPGDLPQRDESATAPVTAEQEDHLRALVKWAVVVFLRSMDPQPAGWAFNAAMGAASRTTAAAPDGYYPWGCLAVVRRRLRSVRRRVRNVARGDFALLAAAVEASRDIQQEVWPRWRW